jgi:molybdopterin synthase sulfur carrier subunit
MAVRVYIPTPYRELTHGQGHVEANGRTIAEVVADLDRQFPGLGDRISVGGTIRHHVNVFVNGQEMRSLDGDETSLADGDEVAFIPALVGGQSSMRNW